VLEAKKDGWTLTGVEHQSKRYLESVPDGVPTWGGPLRFAYEATSTEVQFTDWADPDARSRRVFAVHRPETLRALARDASRHPAAPTLRARLRQLPAIPADAKLWRHQRTALEKVEESLAANRPRTLLQMATGSGKTYTAANLAYRLIRFGGARRVLFLVDRNNLGKQATNEFEQFTNPHDHRRFSDDYPIQRLTGGPVDASAKVVVSTIQGIYAALTRTPPEDEPGEGAEPTDGPPVEVSYSPELPPETFDVIIVDEAHRSIYGRWRRCSTTSTRTSSG
jgi:type I restriction enzyme, R subunit